LVPGLLQTAQVNLFREVSDLKIFELGRVFWPQEGELLPEERYFLGGLLCGRAYPLNCHGMDRPVDFYDLKGILESAFKALGVKGLEFKPHAKEPFLIPALSVSLEGRGKKLGFAGAVRDSVLEKLDLTGPIFIFELDLEGLHELVERQKTYQALPKFPATFRDLALLAPEELPAGEILSFAQGLELAFLERVDLIDVYRGRGVPQGKKSLTLRFTYRAKDRTLTDEEVNNLQEEATKAILARFDVQLR